MYFSFFEEFFTEFFLEKYKCIVSFPFSSHRRILRSKISRKRFKETLLSRFKLPKLYFEAFNHSQKNSLFFFFIIVKNYKMNDKCVCEFYVWDIYI